jgi:tungstate transport system ATP-binding protein
VNALQIDALHKSFGARPLLAIEDLHVTPGELVVLTGDNGSGKSTMLRALAGLEEAQTLRGSYGGIKVDGSVPTSVRRQVVYVHQHPYLFSRSVADNIDYGLRLRGVAASERQSLVTAAIQWAGLSAVVDVPPKRLSGGEKQKLALARAKVLSPRVWLIDEPTANLDKSARAQIVALLGDVAASGSAVIVACHDQEIIQLQGATRWHLEDGRVTHSVAA